MTMEEIEKAVQHIREIAKDDEAAHGEEDLLRARFIRHVADTACGELAKKARAGADDVEDSLQPLVRITVEALT